MGIGHVRRNLLLAEALVGLPERPSILLVAGAAELDAFPLPPGVDVLTLPSLRKWGPGDYRPRRLRVTGPTLRALRARTLAAALTSYRPHVLIVDKLPLGVCGELEPTLQALRHGSGTRCVLGLRDVLDAPASVREEWHRTGGEAAVRSYYDAVWVYGDPGIYDVLEECQLGPEVSRRARFTGYLDPSHRIRRESRSRATTESTSDTLVLCQVGGGQDGGQLAESFAAARFPAGTQGVIVAGPHMPRDVRSRLEDRADHRPDLSVTGFSTAPGVLLSEADHVVSMGGYNSVCEILASGKRALIVPRVRPRSEQLIRASRFAELGLLDMLHPDMASPQAITDWLEQAGTVGEAAPGPNFDGLSVVPRLLRELTETVAKGNGPGEDLHAAD
jgi:predicted glycosyltransferase